MGSMISVTTGPSRQAPLGVSARYTVIQTVPGRTTNPGSGDGRSAVMGDRLAG
jgi:hypothetical protein